MATVTTTFPVLEARQTRVVTQTLTRPSTTITAVVTLGSDPPSTSRLIPNSPTITTPTLTPTSTSTAPVGPATPSSLTNSQLGAILGSVLGFAFLVFLFCCCCLSCRRRPQLDTTYIDYERYDHGSGSEAVQPQGWARTWNNPVSWDRRRVATGTWTTRPPPVRFPPTPRYAYAPYHYRQTSEPQYGA